MKSDKDNISKNEREIDEFLSKFEALDENDSDRDRKSVV